MTGKHFGRYEVIGVIASGGMAKVYLGRSSGVGGFERKVAIKVMHEHIASQPQFVDMFMDEARLAAMLHHPNVVSTIDIQSDAELYLVMDFVDGASVDRVMDTHTKATKAPLPVEVTLRIMVDALAGLHAAHELRGDDGAPFNLVHRDVSPQNILVGVEGIARLTDFGVARAEARISSTREGMIKGKLGYMAVEQLKNEPIDRRTDIYAAGSVLWELLAGRVLFHAEHPAALVNMVLQGPTQAPHEVVPSVPKAISDVCMQALRANPDERFPTAEALSQALQQAAASVGIIPAPTSTVGELARNARRVPKPVKLSSPGVAAPATAGVDPALAAKRTVKLDSGQVAAPPPSYPSAAKDDERTEFMVRTPPQTEAFAPGLTPPQTALLSPGSPPPGGPAAVPHSAGAPTTDASMAAATAQTRARAGFSAPIVAAIVTVGVLAVVGVVLVSGGGADTAESAPAAAVSESTPPTDGDETGETAAEPTAEAAPEPSAQSSAAPSASAPTPVAAPRPFRPRPAAKPKTPKPKTEYDPLRP